MSVKFSAVSQILAKIDSPPGLRSKPDAGDLEGSFDQWFDGGAIRTVTGWTEYHFADGTLAVVPTTPTLQVEVRMPSGVYLTISEQSNAPTNFQLVGH